MAQLLARALRGVAYGLNFLNTFECSEQSPTMFVLWHCRIGRQLLGARFNPSASMPSNCPHWNPGPGKYDPAIYYKGGRMQTGADVPKAQFARADKLIMPQDRFSATVFLSNVRPLLQKSCDGLAAHALLAAG